MNKVIFNGNVGADADVRTVNNTKVANFNVANTERWKDKDGNKQEKTTWMPVVAWGGLATLAEKFIKKGKNLQVTGKLNVRNWTDDQGVKHTVTEIEAEDIEFLGPKPADDMPAA